MSEIFTETPGVPIGAAGIDRLAKLAEGFEARHREYADAAKQNAHDHDFARAQTAIGASYRKCAEQLRDVIGDLASPTAEDFDRAAEAIDERYALVEQMGYRQVIGTVREITFLGHACLEVTGLETGSTRIIGGIGEGLYQLTWMTRDQAERATRTGAHSVAAIAFADAEEFAEADGDESARELAAEGNAMAMSDAERDEYDRDGEAWLDAQDEADEMASVHVEDEP